MHAVPSNKRMQTRTRGVLYKGLLRIYAEEQRAVGVVWLGSCPVEEEEAGRAAAPGVRATCWWWLLECSDRWWYSILDACRP